MNWVAFGVTAGLVSIFGVLLGGGIALEASASWPGTPLPNWSQSLKYVAWVLVIGVVLGGGVGVLA